MIPICPHTLLRLDYTSQFGQQWHTRLPIVTLNYFVLQHKLRQENTRRSTCQGTVCQQDLPFQSSEAHLDV